MPVLVVTLQVLVSLGLAGFGLVALRIGGEGGGGRTAAWRVSGAAFVLEGVNKLCQNVFGILALAGGRGSAVWDEYLAWSPAFNHSRTFALAGFVVALGVLSFTPIAQRRAFPAVMTLLLGGTMVAGMVLGRAEPRLVESTHYPLVAALDAVALIGLLSLLFLLLVRDRVDRLLWIALCIYGFALALNAIWIGALARIATPNAWAPSPITMNAYRLVLVAAMVVVALHRWRLGKRGVYVPALLEPLGRPSPPPPILD